MEQAQIDRLLVGRQAIEKSRVKKLEAREAHNPHQLERMYEEFLEAKTELLATLATLGFASIEAFQLFNEEMCLAVTKEMMPLVSVCDHCKGYEGTAPCIAINGNDACFYTWDDSQKALDQIYRKMLLVRRNEIIVDGVISNRLNESARDVQRRAAMHTAPVKFVAGELFYHGSCPKGHGFVSKIVTVPNEGIPFDLKWK